MSCYFSSIEQSAGLSTFVADRTLILRLSVRLSPLSHSLSLTHSLLLSLCLTLSPSPLWVRVLHRSSRKEEERPCAAKCLPHRGPSQWISFCDKVHYFLWNTKNHFTFISLDSLHSTEVVHALYFFNVDDFGKGGMDGAVVKTQTNFFDQKDFMYLRGNQTCALLQEPVK